MPPLVTESKKLRLQRNTSRCTHYSICFRALACSIRITAIYFSLRSIKPMSVATESILGVTRINRFMQRALLKKIEFPKILICGITLKPPKSIRIKENPEIMVRFYLKFGF